MIEIRIDEHAELLTPDGPHDHDGTRAIAAGIDQAFHLLSYATMHSRGLRHPSDVYGVLGALSAALHKLPQALHQMSQWVHGELAGGHARENPGHGATGGDTEASHSRNGHSPGRGIPQGQAAWPPARQRSAGSRWHGVNPRRQGAVITPTSTAPVALPG